MTNNPNPTGDKQVVTQRARNAAADIMDFEGVFETLEWDGVVYAKAAVLRGDGDDHPTVQAFARFEQDTLSREGREELVARLLKNAEWRDDRRQCVTDPNLLKEAAEALSRGSVPASIASIVVKLSAIRTALREAHWALDDSEDLSHQDPPVHAVPLDNVMRLHRALKACERFAPDDAAWEGPGPLVTEIIEWLGTSATLSPPASEGRDVGRDMFDREPSIVAHSPEPSLRCLVKKYYNEHFIEERADELTEQYFAALSTAPASPEQTDTVLPCDVMVQPATVIKRGCKLSTLLECIELRRERSKNGPPLPELRIEQPLDTIQRLGQEMEQADQADVLRERIAELEELIEHLTQEPLNQDEQGGCVWCGGSAKGRLTATENPKDHSADCPYILSRAALKAQEG